jgi:hypothetical protein
LAWFSRRSVWLAGLAGTLALALVALRLLSPWNAPSGQRALTHLSPSTITTLTERFDAAADSTRLLVLLSPT